MAQNSQGKPISQGRPDNKVSQQSEIQEEGKPVDDLGKYSKFFQFLIADMPSFGSSKFESVFKTAVRLFEAEDLP